MNAHFLMHEGKPAFAVLPIDEYERLMELLEDARDAVSIEQFAALIDSGQDDSIPGDVAGRLLDGENPVMVLRAWRGMTLKQLAVACGVSDAHVSQIEKGKKSMSTQTLKKMAAALDVDVELLL